MAEPPRNQVPVDQARTGEAPWDEVPADQVGTGEAPWDQAPRPPAAQQPERGPEAGQAAPFGSPVAPERSRPGRAASSPGRPGPGRHPRGTSTGERGAAAGRGGARAAIRMAPGESAARGAASAPDRAVPAAAAARPAGASAGRLPWYEVAHARRLAAGQRDCGALERILSREWAPGEIPPPEVVRAIDRLAALPADVQERLADGLDAIHVGPGGVPDLDHMARLRGVPLPSGRATWDSCAGAYGDRKIIVGSRPSSAPDVMCHEVGHALDDIDGPGDEWQSDSAEFRLLYDRCLPLLVSDFHKQDGALGRREFFADAFAAIASRQRPALVDMLGGQTRTALDVMLFFNVRYGI
ncbi:MAG: hypothetical protein ACM32E_33145 [Gemmatimonadota bacterium]